MPWQAHLFVGERVSDYKEVETLYNKLGADIDKVRAAVETGDFDDYDNEMAVPVRYVTYRDKTYEVTPTFYHESEGGSEFPVEEPNPTGSTNALVGFALTTRYGPCILDIDYAHGRPDPFEIDLVGVADILRQVHEWWPEAKILLMDIYF